LSSYEASTSRSSNPYIDRSNPQCRCASLHRMLHPPSCISDWKVCDIDSVYTGMRTTQILPRDNEYQNRCFWESVQELTAFSHKQGCSSHMQKIVSVPDDSSTQFFPSKCQGYSQLAVLVCVHSQETTLSNHLWGLFLRHGMTAILD